MGVGGAGWASARSGSSSFRASAAVWRTPRAQVDNETIHERLTRQRTSPSRIAHRLSPTEEARRALLREQRLVVEPSRGGTSTSASQRVAHELGAWHGAGSVRESARRLKESIKARLY